MLLLLQMEVLNCRFVNAAVGVLVVVAVIHVVM